MQATENPKIARLLAGVPVVPVLTVEDGDEAVELARALARNGLPVLEFTLRTASALAAMRRISVAVPEAIVGAGTVRNPEQAMAAIGAGARFLVAPGVTPRLVEAAERWPVPFLPGVATASEAMALGDLGYRFLKFFPAETSGGAPALAALAAPLPDLSFCPTGGIDAAKAPSYLALPNVIAVGGSWVAPSKLVAAREFDAIGSLARAAAALRGGAASPKLPS